MKKGEKLGYELQKTFPNDTDKVAGREFN